MTYIDSETEAGSVAALAFQAATAQEIEAGKLYVVADSDGRQRTLDTDSHAARPRRKGLSITTVVADVESFGAYLTKHGILDETEIAASVQAGNFIATINAGTTEEPGWGDHGVRLQLTESKEWKRWIAGSNKLMGQAEFAEFIEDNAENIVEPASAEILEIAQSLQIRRGVDFESGHRLSDGNVQFGYRETTTASAGAVGDLTIPASFTLALRPFAGGEAYKVTALFRYRLVQKQLQLGFKLQGAERIREDAFTAIAGTVRDQAEASGYLYLTSD
ncbi:DUF2303 family protein [Arthrobacter sp. UYCu712]|uniref:DUF2303 family protein n=1 Tax=Arthrobacter sp. UYCu712 TaxID=3156340 RepID=UPI0033938F89